MEHKKVLFLCRAAIIAALYFVLSWVSGAFGLASGPIQVRLSEALCILAAFTPAAIPGLAVGCMLYNISSGCIVIDIFLGTAATIIGSTLTYLLSRCRFTKQKAAALLLPLPTVLSNAFIVPYILFFYNVETAYLLNFLTVFIGEFIACEIIGMILYYAIYPLRMRLFNT